MESTVTIDLRQVGRGLDIPLRQIQTTVELLDEGNTVPFITRYRKDQTGGLDEEQVREIQGRLAKMRLLADRKQTILRSIESQGKLTEKLTKQILGATTAKRLEDLYLPFKPKKQTLATLARSRGLEPLAREILEGAASCLDLDARAADFINTDRQVPTAADALLGAGHILAEQFSEMAELRGRLREVLQRTGVLVSARLPAEEKSPPAGKPAAAAPAETPAEEAASEGEVAAEAPTEAEPPAIEAAAEPVVEPPAVPATEVAAEQVVPPSDDNESPLASSETPSKDAESVPGDEPESGKGEAGSEGEEGQKGEEGEPPQPAVEAIAEQTRQPEVEGNPPVETGEVVQETVAAATGGESAESQVEMPATEQPNEAAVVGASEAVAAEAAVAAPAEVPPATAVPGKKPSGSRLGPSEIRKIAKQQAKLAMQKKRELKKKKIEEKKIKDFQDYFDYREEIKKIPPHRVLAINRGERARVLRVKVESEQQALTAVLDEMLVPAEHPHAEYLRGCARDALARLILPSLEREVRRELTDHAETHAVGVFAKNLRNLLLQPPVHNHRLLAVDPGFRSGCKLAALDEFGNLLDQGVVYLVGKPDRTGEARQKVIDLVDKHKLTVVVIGNGTACRHTENFFADMIEKELKDKGVAYVIVNEAGASVYSTSRIGREEFPQYDATLRGAISIGRRLQDPLSELVKIDPANIGVGLYQHDVKAKHLRTSLDDVVESCVNFVGVDVNTASPALLRYVSGLNQLTARRLYEYRREHGPFHTREQLRDVPGLGEATFVQAAGFLKINSGDNPLDATWIHPESYLAANLALERLAATAADLREKDRAAALAERISHVDRESFAKELSVGALTLNDILLQLVRPGRDPREDLPAPVFKRGVIKLEDLTAGMELTGTVLNVVDFGCFVDIGMHDSGLVHVSRLADKYVRDPHDVVAVGDIVKVWVVEIDKERRRVSLTMVRPGSERPKYPQRAARPPRGKPGGEGAAAGGEGQGEQRPPRPQSSGRPPRPEGQGQRRPPRSDGGQRPPRGGGEGRPPRQQGRGRPPREQHRPIQQPRPSPKPVVPITEAMKSGKEPLRTFGDLMQFYQHKVVPAAVPAAPPAPAAAKPPAGGPGDAHEKPTIVGEPVVSETVAQEVAVPPPATVAPVTSELVVGNHVNHEQPIGEQAVAEPPVSESDAGEGKGVDAT
jgi:protein Tex